MIPAERPSQDFHNLSLTVESIGGANDDDDDRDDERADENEIPVRETDEETEAPEEFEIDDGDDLGHPEDDDDDFDDGDIDDDSEE
jgi:hypothetical protein